jgi:hypothetical protein
MGSLKRRIRINRHEFAGSFGDIGTDFPLITGMILAGGLDAASVLIMFGVMQILTGLLYGLPMPAQPLKAVAVLVIAGGVTPEVLYGGGLAIGLAMLLLTLTGLVAWLDRRIPKAVVRGIQVGLGLKLAELALGDYVQAAGLEGYLLAAVCFALVLALGGSRRLPAALPVIALGILYGLVSNPGAAGIGSMFGFALPQPRVPSPGHVLEGFLVLGLAQLPLSLGNSLFATRQLAADLFGREMGVRKIALTYSAMNLVNPFLSGVPTCHGSGGMAGHYAFGARTGGAPLIYGALYLALGLFLSRGFDQVVHLFPLPVLGVILLFEGLALARLVRDMTGDAFQLGLVLLVALCALALPYGFLVGLVAGTAVHYVGRGRSWLGDPR